MRLGRLNLTYANVMATVAVFIALGGTGYAISKLPKNSVKSPQIARSAVKKSEIATGSVRSSEVLDGSLLGTDFAPGQIPTGKTGPPGPPGDPGDPGAPGAPGPTYAEVESNGDPVATPDSPNLFIAPITTPNAGHLLVMLQAPSAAGIKVTCSAGNGSAGLYVDNVPVPDTRVPLVSGSAIPVSKFAPTAGSFPAGHHTLGVGFDCTSGNVTSASIDTIRSFGAILLG